MVLAQVLSAAQTVDFYINQGRSFLSATNITSANLSFSNAVLVSPNNPTANVFYAVTRLLVLPYQQPGSDFLTRIGMPKTGRNIYKWKAKLPTDTNGVPYAPTGVNANEFTAVLRTNILPALINADANLTKVTNSNFTLSLTSNETRTVNITIDYGDVLMSRAVLNALEYLGYTAYSWNLGALLSTIRHLYDNGDLSFDSVLTEYPKLFTFATTNDLNSAKAAFQNAVSLYLKSSEFIRSRPTNVVRLFNYDPDKADDEEKARLTMIDLTNSLLSAVTLSVETNYTVFLGSRFSGRYPIRSFLPQASGNGIIAGTVPDPTFGGLIYGISEEQIENFIFEKVQPIPKIATVSKATGKQIVIPVNVGKFRGYVVQVSTNLLNWNDFYPFYTFDGHYQFIYNADSSRCFYRLVDRTENMPPPPNDMFAKRKTIPGMNIPVASYTMNASLEPEEVNLIQSWQKGHTIWWTWTSPISAEVDVVAFSSSDYRNPIIIFTGNSISSLTEVANNNGWDDVRFNAQAGVNYQIFVDSNCWGPDGGVQIVITQPPVLQITSPQNNVSFPLHSNILIEGIASDPDGQIAEVSLSIYGMQSSIKKTLKLENGRFSYQMTNAASGYYSVNISVKDSAGAQQSIYISFNVE